MCTLALNTNGILCYKETAGQMANFVLAGLNYLFGTPMSLTDNRMGFGEGESIKTQKSRGWGEKIEWLNLADGFVKAKNENVPVMVVIHKMTCSACVYQKAWFSRSKKVESLSKNMVMVNLEVHEVPSLPEYTPDGAYVPRILFFSPNGKFMPDVKMTYNPQYKYNYPGEIDLTNTMKTVIDKFRKP